MSEVVAISSDEELQESEYLVQRMEWIYAEYKRKEFISYSNARDLEDEALCRELEEKNLHLEALYDDEGPCQYTEFQQYLRIITFWLRMVKNHEKYGKYCTAIESGEPVEDAVMGEFFKDWGDVRDVEDEIEWIKENYDLFMPKWIVAVRPGDTVSTGELPVLVEDGELAHVRISEMFETLQEQWRTSETKPKYYIEKVRGETYAATAQRLYLSNFVSDQLDEDFFNDSIRGVTKKYLLEWEIFRGMQGGAYDPKHKYHIGESIDSHKKSIKRWRDTYKACSENPIVKKFPPKHTSLK